MSEGVLFSRLLEGFIVGSVFKNFGERFTAKNHHPVTLFSLVSKVFEKLVSNRIVDHPEKCGLFSDFLYGLVVLDQLHVFLQLYLIELQGLLKL